MVLQDFVYFLVVGIVAYWLFIIIRDSYLKEEFTADGLTEFGRQWYWPSYWYNTYWPFYRRQYNNSYPYGYFPYQSYYSTYYY